MQLQHLTCDLNPSCSISDTTMAATSANPSSIFSRVYTELLLKACACAVTSFGKQLSVVIMQTSRLHCQVTQCPMLNPHYVALAVDYCMLVKVPHNSYNQDCSLKRLFMSTLSKPTEAKSKTAL
jgi:hypothetical protein